MHKGRLEAFSDGVIAIIITIMVLELHAPHEVSLEALKPLIPVLLSYVLSFIYVGIYWSNHHHLFQIVKQVNGATLWANLHLLFWMSLIPFVTGWMGENHFARLTVATYGVVLLTCAIAYYMLAVVLLRKHGRDSKLAAALGRDFKTKSSMLIYAIAIPLTCYSAAAACALYVLVAIMWLVPDRRIEKVIADEL